MITPFFYNKIIDYICKNKKFEINSYCLDEYSRDSILQYAIKNDRTDYLTFFLDHYNIPSKGLTLKHRLSLYFLIKGEKDD